MEERSFSIAELVIYIWKRKFSVLIASSLFAVVVFIHDIGVSDYYKSTVTFAPVDSGGGISIDNAGSFGGIASLAGIGIAGRNSDVSANIATLKSRLFLMEYIKEDNLLEEIMSRDCGFYRNFLNCTNQNGETPSLLEAYEKMADEIIGISEDKKTGLMTLSITWKDAEFAAYAANRIVKKANAFIKAKTVSQTNDSIKFLNDQVAQTSEVRIKELLYGLIEKELKKVKLTSVNDEFAFKIIDPALPPLKKNGPRRLARIITGFVLGFVLSCFVIFLKKAAFLVEKFQGKK